MQDLEKIPEIGSTVKVRFGTLLVPASGSSKNVVEANYVREAKVLEVKEDHIIIEYLEDSLGRRFPVFQWAEADLGEANV